VELSPLRFVASSPRGFGDLLAAELRSLGAIDVRERTLGVEFAGPLDVAYRACLESRVGSRVFLVVAQFTAPTDAAFYDAARAIDWRAHIDPARTLACDFSGKHPEITHTRFLMSAERLFCVHGYEGTKIRAIATLSNANLGMLSHYWGSKRALFREVFERRLRPIHEERMRRFRLIERAQKAGRPVSLVDVLKAQIEPAFILPGTSSADAQALRLLLGRALTDPSPDVVKVMGEIFTESANVFFTLLKTASPDIDHSEFYWRANCVVGAFAFAESYTERLTLFIDEDLSDIDWAAASNYVVRFLAAGMRAPAATSNGTKVAPRRRKARGRAE